MTAGRPRGVGARTARGRCVASAPIEHPPWCRTTACGVARTPAGSQIGTHVGPAVVIGDGGRLVVKLELRQIDGGEAHILVEVTRDGRRAVSVDLDPQEAELAGGALLEMAQRPFVVPGPGSGR